MDTTLVLRSGREIDRDKLNLAGGHSASDTTFGSENTTTNMKSQEGI